MSTCSQPTAFDDTRLTLFVETDAFYDDMLAAIAGARRSVWLETYIFAADETGWQSAETLCERARAGVLVRLRVDSAGALESPHSKRIRRYLHDAGVELRWFNRLRRALPSRLNRRDHRKLLLIDGRHAYVGSSNIMRSNSRRLCGAGCTRQVDARVDGPLARQLAENGTALWRSKSDSEPAWRPVAERGSQFVASSRFSPTRPLRTLYCTLLEQARHTAYMGMGYFVPDEGAVRAVQRAADGGVDVRLILQYQTDMTPARWGAHAFYARLLGSGIRIYEYMPSIFHAKMLVADSCWAVLGSGNFDYRSFYLNYELNLETRDEALCRQLQRVFLGDLEHCEEVTADDWSRRPWYCRLRERLVWPARRHL